MTHATLADVLPDTPSFSEEDMRKCRETNDYKPVLFEWYKYVGSLSVVVAHIQRNSPAFKEVALQHFHILAGLLNRCARLMLANIALSHQGRFGETTAIVDRCILESALKVVWLCEQPEPEKFTRYLADGLKTEIEFKNTINSNIANRQGVSLPIETRMLTSIANHITASGLTDEQIIQSKKLPDLSSVLTSIGLNRMAYIAIQKLGSHHVHGTWPSLLFHYLKKQPGDPLEFVPRGHDCATHINQFMFIPVLVLRALRAYLCYVIDDESERRVLEDLFQSAEEKMGDVYTEAIGGDWTA